MKQFAMLMTLSTISYLCQSQDCNSVFEVNAGPDIDVCEGGSVDLHGTIGGDATISEWIGGKGIFSPDRNSADAEYTPSTDEYGTTVSLTLSANNPKLKCPSASAKINITVNNPVKANSGSNQKICLGNPVQLSGTVSGKYSSVQWVSSSNGMFENKNNLITTYTPSEIDLTNKAFSLTLFAIPFGACPPDESTMIVNFDDGAEFSTETEKNISGGGPFELKLSSRNKLGEVNWNSEGTGLFTKKNSLVVTYSPSLKDLESGKLILHVDVKDQNNKCSMKKDITVHFKDKP